MTTALYVIALAALGVSFFKSKGKSILALKKAWKSFENILPQFLSILIIIGVMLAILTPEQISKVLGSESGWYGVLIAAVIGSITLVPAFVAFPLAAALLRSGAGYMRIAAFVSTLMMVGVMRAKALDLVKRYRIFLILAVLNIAILIFFPHVGVKSVQLTWSNLIEMLSVLPPIFILLGLLDVWVKRETMIKYMGNNSGLIGVLLTLCRNLLGCRKYISEIKNMSVPEMLKHLWKIDICVCKICGGHMGATKKHTFIRD